MFEATLSIDLGASYTKVAYRKNCVPSKKGSAVENARLLLVDGSPLIPSLAIQTRSRSKPWVFGSAAANLKPDATMKVFQNWKAHLFRPQNDRNSAAAVIVAEHFFGWLKAKLEDAHVNLARAQTRIAMPAFRSFEEKALVVALCMEMNGWESPLILKATEPHANAVGLFSEGRNVVTRTPYDDLLLNYGKMFGPENEWVQTARCHTLYGDRSNLVTAMIVDIGAFTTDLAAMTFDIALPGDEIGDGLQRIEQESHALGVINDLDRPLFAALAEAHGIDWSTVSFQEAELIKRSIYNNNNYSLLTKSSGIVEVGQGKDRHIIEHFLGAFIDAVWLKAFQFVQRTNPSIVYFTGGGIMIAPVAKGLERRLRDNRLRLGIVPRGDGSIGAEQWRHWKESGEGMHRLATALGGASVVLQAGSQTVHSGTGRPVRREPVMPRPESRFITCRCQGGNKDCCFCGGRGYYSRPSAN